MKTFYDTLTNNWNVRMNTFRTNQIVSLVNGFNGDSVLDVGCGSGNITKCFNGTVVGVDISEEAIRQAQEKGINCKVSDLNTRLDFDDNSFDVVSCQQTIEHVYNTEVLMEEIKRVLKPGGHLVISTPNMNMWLNRIAVPLGFQPFYTDVANARIYGNRFKMTIHKNLNFAGHIRLMNLWSLKELIEKHGMKLIKHYGSTSFKNKLFVLIDKILCVVYPRLATDMVVVARKVHVV